MVDRLLGSGTPRHYYYELGLKGIRLILNEGWKSFFRKTKYWLRLRKLTPRQQKLSLPKFKAKISPIEVKKLVFPIPSKKPTLSIIVSVYNKWRYTTNCIKSICENTEGDYEIIIVDDASNDETANGLSGINNLRLIRNEQNAGYIESCNQGAKESRGQYILFLNNDTMVTENWLPPLLEVIEKKYVGAVGPKLVYSDGILQEAGSIVWNDGSALGYGRGDDSSKPEYNYVREIDYCSGACLLVKRELFKNIGGFDERLKPGYYEDTDLCFSLRNLGYKVIYQPKSVVVHFEGITYSTDAFTSVKRYQEINKPKFVDKWNAVLQKHHYYPNSENVLFARNRLLGKNVLVMDDRIPTPSQGGGYPRAHNMLKLIGEFGYKVTFYPLDNTTPWQPYTDEFQQLGIEVFYNNYLNFMSFAKDRAGYYDLILISRPHNMEKTSSTIKKYFPNTVVLYDAEAIFSLREILKARVKGTKHKENDAERMINEEINLINKADFVITVSEKEKAIVLEKTQLNNVTVWGHSIEVKEPQTPFVKRKDMLFVGGFLAPDSPNEDAILYFSKEVFPEIEEELSCQLFIVGMNPPDSVTKSSSSSIIVTGYIENLKEYYEKCRIFIVPHRYSAGIPWKLQEAISYGIPSVVSELTASQLGLMDGNEVLVARNTEEFRQKVIKLYQDEELWYQIQQNALNYIREACNPDALRTKLNEAIERGLRYQDESLHMSRNIIRKVPANKER
ncbi:glycosyltransferase [Chloroflexota bacterium]